jgi:hypothetical protein
MIDECWINGGLMMDERWMDSQSSIDE